MLLLLLLSEEPGSRSDRAIADVVPAELADELRVAFLYKSGCLAGDFHHSIYPLFFFPPIPSCFLLASFAAATDQKLQVPS